MELKSNEKARKNTEPTDKAIDVDTESECDLSNAHSEPNDELPEMGSDEIDLI